MEFALEIMSFMTNVNGENKKESWSKQLSFLITLCNYVTYMQYKINVT